jgi:putative flavoprotein involved in K+ transport
MRKVLGRIGCDPDAVPPVSVDADPRGHAAPRTVLWATGFRREYPWLELPVLSADGEIVQHHGVTPVPGLYTVGLRFQRKRKSHFVGGVGEDARLLAARISATSATTRDAGLRVAA